MLFNSYIFILLFLPVTLLGYYGLNRLNMEKAATGFLVAMSLWFYGYNSLQYLVLLIISVLLNFTLVHYIRKEEQKKKFLMILGVVFNLGILFVFKYFDFFIDNINQIFKSDIGFLRLALPLGISFYTFQQLSYVIDSYKGDCEEYSFLDYASYVTFFPQLIAGPIVYHNELIPEFRKKENRKINYANMSRGFYAFSLGLAKKVLIADKLSPIVAIAFDRSLRLNVNTAWIGMICFALQLYFDFSGYCDMAYGIGYMFNVELPTNFNSPYKATSISDFWKRWHMTLTRFFTKYVYIPLGGNRKGKIRRDINIFIVFLLSGFWHGAAWTFVVWGVLHGILQIIDRYIGKLWQKLPRIIKTPVTFIMVTVLWTIFRAGRAKVAYEVLDYATCKRYGNIDSSIIDYVSNLFEIQLIDRLGIINISSANIEVMVYVLVAILILCVFTLKNTQEKIKRFNFEKRKIVVALVLMTYSLISFSGVSEFLYFNF